MVSLLGLASLLDPGSANPEAEAVGGPPVDRSPKFIAHMPLRLGREGTLAPLSICDLILQGFPIELLPDPLLPCSLYLGSGPSQALALLQGDQAQEGKIAPTRRPCCGQHTGLVIRPPHSALRTRDHPASRSMFTLNTYKTRTGVVFHKKQNVKRTQKSTGSCVGKEMPQRATMCVLPRERGQQSGRNKARRRGNTHERDNVSCSNDVRPRRTTSDVIPFLGTTRGQRASGGRRGREVVYRGRAEGRGSEKAAARCRDSAHPVSAEATDSPRPAGERHGVCFVTTNSSWGK